MAELKAVNCKFTNELYSLLYIMTIVFLRLFIVLLSSSLLALATSLPFQAISLLILSLTVATRIGRVASPLLGVYIVLIYSRGLLVLLAYFITLSPNQTLNSPPSVFLIIICSIIILALAQTYTHSIKSQVFNFSIESSSVITILNPSSSILLVMIGVILIITIISVVKILSVSRKPIRPWTTN